ncbi:MAG: hypothetical protein OEW27_10330 [Aquincola sp.]|nr:hypothetical protein [Aquincola sp.]MDH5330334.1 hypothetical protein [Aquincola sp.]
MRTAVSQLLAATRAPSLEAPPTAAVADMPVPHPPRDWPDTAALYLGLDVQYLGEDALTTYFGELPSDPDTVI